MSVETRKQLQKFLQEKGHYSGAIDGIVGTGTKNAILACFVNKQAPAISHAEKLKLAERLGDKDTNRINAVAKVEANGSGWLKTGQPKILYERHKFWQFNDDPRAPKSTYFNYPQWGNYTIDADKNGIDDSYDKLLKACEYDPVAAFKAISIGAFQVLGEYHKHMGYATPWEMLYAATNSEKAQYELLVSFIEMKKGQSKFLALSTRPDDCRPFALIYNGKLYAKHDYHGRLAAAVKYFRGK